jgi:hypothetical protein
MVFEAIYSAMDGDAIIREASPWMTNIYNNYDPARPETHTMIIDNPRRNEPGTPDVHRYLKVEVLPTNNVLGQSRVVGLELYLLNEEDPFQGWQQLGSLEESQDIINSPVYFAGRRKEVDYLALSDDRNSLERITEAQFDNLSDNFRGRENIPLTEDERNQMNLDEMNVDEMDVDEMDVNNLNYDSDDDVIGGGKKKSRRKAKKTTRKSKKSTRKSKKSTRKSKKTTRKSKKSKKGRKSRRN